MIGVFFKKSKNKIVGEEFEALELYPARSRHMDEGNCYHLWILAPHEGETRPPKIPVGHWRESKLLILQQKYEQMEPARRQALDAEYSIMIFPNEALPAAKVMFPDELDEQAMMKYARAHAELFYK